VGGITELGINTEIRELHPALSVRGVEGTMAGYLDPSRSDTLVFYFGFHGFMTTL
jgi:hypothetical protein